MLAVILIDRRIQEASGLIRIRRNLVLGIIGCGTQRPAYTVPAPMSIGRF